MPNNSVEKALGVDICESGVMQNAIELWHNMYKNEPPWRGGKDNVIPLNLPSAISEEFARLILTEFSMEVTGSPMAAFINEQLKDQLTDLNKFVEMYCEGGAIAVKPFVTNIVGFRESGGFLPMCVQQQGRDNGGGVCGRKEDRRLPVYQA